MANKSVLFYLGPAVGLVTRQLTVVARNRITSVQTALAVIDPTYDADEGSTATYTTVTLPVNKLWQATLVDTDSGGNVSRKDVVSFSTAINMYPGPKSDGRLQVMSIENA